MGYLLRRWLADRLPADLAHGERLVALEFADQANDITRRAYSKDLLKTIAHRAGYANEKQVGAVLGKLAKRGIELRVQIVKDGKPFFDTKGRPVFACTKHETTYKIPTERECAVLVPPAQDLGGTELTGPQDGLGPALTGPKVPQTQPLGPATTGPFSSVSPQDQPSEDLSLPAVGELQHRREIPTPDLRPESEEPDPHLTDPGPATAPPSEPAPSQSPIWAILSAIPEPVRTRITPAQQPELVNAIRAELATEARSVAELVERVRRRWLWWEHTGESEKVGHPVVAAKTLIQRRHCPDARCEDGVNLDSGLPCLACADSRPLKSQPAEPITPTAEPRPAPISSMSSSPAARTVAEALAPVPYVDDHGQTAPDRPSRSSGGPNAAVAELRARWASNGVHTPRERRAVATSPVLATEEPDSPVKAARAYLGGRGDFDDWMTAARAQLGAEAPRDEVFLLAAELAQAS